MERNPGIATPEQVEKLEEMGFRQNTNTGNWVKLGADGAPRLMVYPVAYLRGDGLDWIACHLRTHRKFADPVTAVVWLLLEDSA